MSKAEAEIVLELAKHARLMGMAADSYRKHFGDRAVEAAEKDVLGQAILRLRQFVEAFDKGEVELNSPEIGGESDVPLHLWHEEWLQHARAVLAQADALAAG